MTDKELWLKAMNMMGFKVTKDLIINGVHYYEHEAPSTDDGSFTRQGYEEFYSGASFDDKGGMVKGYLDSHVAHTSESCKKLQEEMGSA